MRIKKVKIKNYKLFQDFKRYGKGGICSRAGQVKRISGTANRHFL